MAVRALLHYALEIPDLSVGERFYRNFGLAGKSTRDEAVHAFLRCSSDHHNVAFLIRDPWGSFAEYFFDLDHIPESCAWEPRDFPEQEALYRWGPEPPPDFGENKELG